MPPAPSIATVTCPHCSADAVAGAGFCGSCGMALPALSPTGPRVVDARRGVAQTSAGAKLRADELLATAKRAARSLRSIGIVNLAFAGINVYLMTQNPRLMHSTFLVAMTASMALAGGIYIGLYFWANVHPLSATIVGLVVYLLKWGGDVAINQWLARGTNASASGTYYFARVLMIVYLIRGIMAALQHRKLEQQQAAGAAPLPVLTAE